VDYWTDRSHCYTQVCQNEKEGDIAAKKKELELADEEDFGNDCVGKAGISPSFLLICLFFLNGLSVDILFVLYPTLC
jgi:hypothetical protein